MNVLSLPDEMLASVLKYNSFEDLTAVRKVPSKIDSVARRYGMDKLIVDRLQIVYCDTEIAVYIVVMNDTKHYRFAQPLPADLLDILKYYFSKIRGVKDLDLNNFTTPKMSISNEVGEFLLGNGCKKLTNLLMHDCDISINFNTMRRLMTKLKPKNLDIRASFTEFEFSDAVIEGILFDRLVLMNRTETLKPMQLSLPYVVRLCSLKIPSWLICTIYNSTVSDLINFVKGWTEKTLNTVILWSIEISKGMMSVDETKQSLAKLKFFEDYEVTHENEEDIPTFYIIQKNYGKIKMMIRILP